MNTILAIIAIVCLLIGLMGCVLPALPGPPLSYIGMLLVHWSTYSFSTSTLIIWGALTIVVTILDFWIPVWGAKLFGATKYGIYGSVIGMLLGIFFTPIGMIGGLLLGAIIGDSIAGKSPTEAIKAGLGTFLGTMLGMAVKLGVSGAITFITFYKITQQFYS